MAKGTPAWQLEFLGRHALDQGYLPHAQLWFDPLAAALATHHNSASRPLLIAVNGCQGSGKTTLCHYLVAALQAGYGVKAISLSLDDFYLTRGERQQLAQQVHPLLATRGVPGTHDMALLQRTLDDLLDPHPPFPISIPRFDKATDDRFAESAWDTVDAAMDVVLLEGWCLGARPQQPAQLVQPVNALERDEDERGRWRRHVNEALARDFLPLYARVDQWVMLQAPSFDCVYRWRLEQEQKLAATTAGAGLMTRDQLARFIQHYQRLTQHCLEHLPAQVDYLFRLDGDRRIRANGAGGRKGA